MKKLSMPFIPCAVAASLIVAGGLSASGQTLALQLQAVNYNPGTGLWLDSSGNGNNAQFLNGTTPTLAAAVTPALLSAVNIIGSNASYGVGSHFQLNTPISDTGGGYTVFAYIASTRPTSQRSAITGGSNGGALEWDFYGGNDDFLREYQADVAHGNAIITIDGTFNLVDLAVNSTGSSFKFNGSPDGTGAGAAFTSPITQIGNNEGGGDYFSGDIAEIDIYQGVLTSGQIAAVEATLDGEYVTGTIPVNPMPVPEPTTLALMAGGFGLLLAARRFARK
jgi:hypothetical protein